ncbi:hypothetical protein N7481_002326 [Penicillium waksmanii]|uniref:uncharacterized protein n=1 Tax=Penicillium waksmanii TaxID=69791 RepID=UPI002546F2AD|nr:uncharacterized protein N7481_002326 [Penicillium waksmanii]KAJ5995349.1 hypothetical protein N7481_002326 [Penicillium waksmanii]
MPWEGARDIDGLKSDFLSYLDRLSVIREAIFYGHRNYEASYVEGLLGCSVQNIEAAQMQISGRIANSNYISCMTGGGLLNECIVVDYEGVEHCVIAELNARRNAILKGQHGTQRMN